MPNPPKPATFHDFVSDVADGNVLTTPKLQALAHRYRAAHVYINRVVADRKFWTLRSAFPLREPDGSALRMQAFDENYMATYELEDVFEAAFRRAIATPTSALEVEAKNAADVALGAFFTLFEVEPP